FYNLLSKFFRRKIIRRRRAGMELAGGFYYLCTKLFEVKVFRRVPPYSTNAGRAGSTAPNQRP
ncbi:hypothetical protein, partial [Alistipes indistinctus]|uniref:hypothetical protein n=1 Tax=Alistipes indistinctus TaxID=626932 RepID=UPI003AB08B27